MGVGILNRVAVHFGTFPSEKMLAIRMEPLSVFGQIIILNISFYHLKILPMA
jgi:hypothetical protein